MWQRVGGGAMARKRTTQIVALDDHPNLPEILGALAQLAHVSDAALPRLAKGWHNTVFLAEARARALSPDSPLVLEVLSAFEAVQALFADDLSGEEDYLSVEPEVAAVALKAIRDAIAAAYARPVLSRTEHSALMAAWRSVYAIDLVEEPDLGERGTEIKNLLSAMPRLAGRGHDADAAALFGSIVALRWVGDEGVRAGARQEGWSAAIPTNRRRIWAPARRSGAEGSSRYSPPCRPPHDHGETTRVLSLTLYAGCALLV